MATGHSHPGAVIIDHPPALEGFAFVDSLDKIRDRQQNEALHTLIPHADDPVLQREHLTLNQLVRYDQVTHFAVNSGDWSSPSLGTTESCRQTVLACSFRSALR